MGAVQLLKTDVAEGKTTMVLEVIVSHIKKGRNVVFAAPNHELLGEVYQRLKNAMESAGFNHKDIGVWHGVIRENMCLRPDDAKAVAKAGFSVKSTLCQTALLDGDGAFAGVQPLCPHAKTCGIKCGMTEQRHKHPKVWLVPHASLFDNRDALFDGGGGVDTLVIDESITSTAMPSYGDYTARLKKSVLARIEGAPSHVLRTWGAIADTLDKHTHSLSEQYDANMLFNAGIDKAIAWHEEKRKELGVIVGLSGDQLKAELARASGVKEHVRRLEILREIKRLNRDGDKKALWVETSSDGEKRLAFWKLKTVHPRWIADASTVIAMDATPLEDLDMLAKIFGRDAELADQGRKANPPSPIVHTTIIKNGPVSKSRRESERGIARMREFLKYVCDTHGGQNMCVMKSGYSIYDADDPQPSNLDVTSSGYAMGSNNWEKADTVSWFGPNDAGPRAFEIQASLFGRLSETLPDPDSGRLWWPQKAALMPVRNGEPVGVKAVWHPCEAVLALRTHSQHGRIYQGVGRGRSLRRDESCPLHIFVCTNEDVGLQADRVVEWRDIVREVTIENKLKTTGIFMNPSHHSLVDGRDPEAVKDEFRRTGLSGYTSGAFPNIINIKDSTQRLTETNIHYSMAGNSNRHAFHYAPDAPFADDPLKYVQATIGKEVFEVVDALEAMEVGGIVYTAPSHAYNAVPKGWPSLNAAKQAFHHSPPQCPHGWTECELLTAGSGQRPAMVYVRSDIAADKAHQLIERQLGRKIKELSLKTAD